MAHSLPEFSFHWFLYRTTQKRLTMRERVAVRCVYEREKEGEGEKERRGGGIEGTSATVILLGQIKPQSLPHGFVYLSV